MGRHRLDQLAALLAATRSRRHVVRVATAGIVSTVVLARSAQPAAAELCPERIPKRGYTPDVNGCGPSGYGWTVPDSYGDASFTPACNRHDRCYGTCNKDRMTCDFLMRKSMQQACKQAYRRDDERKQLRKCFGRARLYFNVVSENGQSAYEAAQEEACLCCDAPRSTRCGDVCCITSSCHECVNGTCHFTCPPNHWCSSNVCKPI